MLENIHTKNQVKRIYAPGDTWVRVLYLIPPPPPERVLKYASPARARVNVTKFVYNILERQIRKN